MQTNDPELVARVLSVKTYLMKSFPPIFRVHATGEVPTSGWTAPELSPLVYIDPPADGIQEYEFVAVRPDGFVSQVVTEIEAEHDWEDVPSWVKGARVKSATNSMEDKIFDEVEDKE